MKKRLRQLGIIACCIGSSALMAEGEAECEITENSCQEADDVVKLSKAFGHLIGQNLDNPGIKFDLESIVQGMRDAANGLDSPMSEQEYEETIAAIQERAFNDLAHQNLSEANAFLEANSIAEGIVEVAPGKLQYKVISEGIGSAVAEGSAPTINYRGTYIDGSLFGSSDDTGGPVTLPLDQTLPGFKDGILGMKEGEKRRIYIHPDLGYGTAGHLPPNSLLVFDVEVIASGATDEPIAVIEPLEPANTEVADIENDVLESAE